MNTQTETLNEMAALSRLCPQGHRNSKGRPLPLRYRAAERIVAEEPAAGPLTMAQYREATADMEG